VICLRTRGAQTLCTAVNFSSQS